MPLKTCPKCGGKCGPRTRQCKECGHDFKTKASRRKSAIDYEPGNWILEKRKGLPPIEPPEPLPRGPITTEDLRHYIAHEGIGFCIHCYIPWKRIENDHIRRIWYEAKLAITRVIEAIEAESLHQLREKGVSGTPPTDVYEDVQGGEHDSWESIQPGSG